MEKGLKLIMIGKIKQIIKNVFLFCKLRFRRKTKIFVIGFNKTGTTSVHRALQEFDLIVGNQREAEILMDKIIEGDISKLFSYVRRAEAFQDVPFSLPNFYEYLDEKFPKSKFILTIRDNDQQWFNSLVNFHSKLWGNGNVPTSDDLLNANYIYKGNPFKTMSYVYGEGDFYEPCHYKSVYNQHNNNVIKYFKNRPNDLLVLNVASDDGYLRLCEFIGENPVRKEFTWENKTSLK